MFHISYHNVDYRIDSPEIGTYVVEARQDKGSWIKVSGAFSSLAAAKKFIKGLQ